MVDKKFMNSDFVVFIVGNGSQPYKNCGIAKLTKGYDIKNAIKQVQDSFNEKYLKPNLQILVDLVVKEDMTKTTDDDIIEVVKENDRACLQNVFYDFFIVKKGMGNVYNNIKNSGGKIGKLVDTVTYR